MSRFPMQTSMIIALMLVSFVAKAGNVYHCLDKRGGYVFSDKPCLDQSKHGDSEAEVVWRELKALVASGRDMTSSQSSNVESIVACKSTQRELSTRLEALRDRVESVAQRHTRLTSAYDQIQQCLECRASASYYCSSAEAKLNGALDQFHKR